MILTFTQLIKAVSCTFVPDSPDDTFNVDGEVAPAVETHITVLQSAVAIFFAL